MMVRDNPTSTQYLPDSSPFSTFFCRYDKAPLDAVLQSGGVPMDPTETGDYSPPALNSPYRPSFSEICTYYINLYPPKQWWHYEYIAGFASSTDIEVQIATSAVQGLFI
jgi:hypothetical protein